MHKASPVELRTSIGMAHSLAQIGVRLSLIPISEPPRLGMNTY
ncbi:DUF1382 family protein, partial [Escherichia coli]